MNQTESVQRQFGAAARNYAKSGVHSGGADLDAMVEVGRPRPGLRVLDVGCGAGHTALAFAAGGAAVTALDITQPMLDMTAELAAERGLEIALELAPAERMPFAEASFDLVSCRVCAHHFNDVAASLREVERVLVGGGCFLLVDSVSPESPLVDTFFNAIELIRDPSHVRNYRISEWARMFAEAGLGGFDVLGEYPYRIEFDPWIERIGATPEAAAQVRAMFAGAPVEVRTALRIAPDASFDVPASFMCGIKAPS